MEEPRQAIDTISWRKICQARDEVKRCQEQEDEAKRNHQDCKAATQSAQKELNGLIDELAEPSLYDPA